MHRDRLQADGYSIFKGLNALESFFETFQFEGKQVLVLTDTNTSTHCYHKLATFLPKHIHHTIADGEANKYLRTCETVWNALSEAHFSRQDIVINLGGGMVCDLGGFSASCYKRGIDFVHIPTSLLAMADASVGGKTGVNLQGFKNQVGAFSNPAAVVLDARFLNTLPSRELRSGYAEVLKHALIADKQRWEHLSALNGIPSEWSEIIADAVATKLYFTENDPKEKGIRKALNFGHTIGHALESHFLDHHPEAHALHGEAVAAGMWCEAWLSKEAGLLNLMEFESISNCLAKIYPKINLSEPEVPAIANWAKQDKKNAANEIRCVLLNAIGDFVMDHPLSIAQVQAALQQYRLHYPSI